MAKFISLDNIRTFYNKLKSIFTRNSLIRLDGIISGTNFTLNTGDNTTVVTGVYYHSTWGNIYGKASNGQYYQIFKDSNLYSNLNSNGDPKPITTATYIIGDTIYKGGSSLSIVGQVVSTYEKDTIMSLSSALYEENVGVIPKSTIGSFKELSNKPYLQCDTLTFENADTGYEEDTTNISVPIADNTKYGFTKLNVYKTYQAMPKLTSNDVGTMYWSTGENKPYWWTGSAWRSF